ncbi:MAG TPA: hypothetical protein VHR45_21105 [Thermoanaerobaculia bacterium]|nr:hypothetical protein [Thermoanaerobaculia bacterium]
MNQRLWALVGLLSLAGLGPAAGGLLAPPAPASPQGAHQTAPGRAQKAAPQAGTGQADLAAQRQRQRKTIAAMRNVGTAMFSWLTDQVGGAAASGRPGQSPLGAARTAAEPKQPQVVNLTDYPPIAIDRLRRILVPTYLNEVDERDGWGNAFDFRLDVDHPLAQHVMCIRSAGKDGRFTGDVYTVGAFDPDDFDQDIVWCDGYFVRWPQKESASSG